MSTGQKLKYKMVKESIREQILSRHLKPGIRLPSEQSLAKEWGISALTVRQGLAELESEGLIVKKYRVGNFVNDFSEIINLALVLPRHYFDGIHNHPATGLITSGIMSALDQQKYSLNTLAYTPSQLWADIRVAIVANNIKGIMLWPHSQTKPEDLKHIQKSGIAVVMFGSSKNLDDHRFPWVGVDSNGPLFEIKAGLIDLGHRHIAIAMYTDSYNMAMTEICNKKSSSVDITTIRIPNPPGEIDYSKLADLFDIRPKPTAVIVPDEFCATELFRLCHKRNIRIPDDLSVAALSNNTPHAFPVSLTAPESIELNFQRGKQVANTLIRLVTGKRILTHGSLLRPEVQWKDSVQALKK